MVVSQYLAHHLNGLFLWLEFLYQVSNQQYARYNQAIFLSLDRVVITGMLFPDFINWGIGYDK